MKIKINTKDELAVTTPHKFYVTMSQPVYDEIMFYIEQFDTEVSGLGLIQETKHEG